MDSPSPSVVKKVMVAATEKPRYYIAKRHFDEPNIFCLSSGRKITNLSVSIEFELEKPREGQKSELMYRVFFIDEHNEVISDVKEIRLKYGEVGKVNFMLASKASSVNRCMLAMQSDVDSVDELQQLIPFEVSMSFTSDFDF